ncbi:MAG: methyl-accepting chemotaxis protein [Pelotomaculum sp.]|uniref:Methyl-accepting chemotaxis protein n=1 Tax=Pelotomaculum thermopropionicum (strain DSM 13744 / JCM 10971 / SI) TaxID=370438 RepID=A5CYB2_PELTS|nr:methyl-accepting chemotaxis protein [Pelotomaculum sp.]BAF61036.1 methyl-accepting chemotaxis protein [Pelotomaculum thermopropionicum SI]
MKTVREKLTCLVFGAGLLAATLSLAGWYAAGCSLAGLAAGTAAGVLLVTGAVYFFNVSFSRTLKEYLEWSAGMAEGKFDYNFKHERKEKDMARFFENVLKMNKGVGKYTLEVQKQAQVLADAARKIFSSTEQISSGSREQSLQVQNMHQAIEELAAAAGESAQKAERAAEVARTSLDTVTTGAEAIEKISGGMQLIYQRIEELGFISAKIGQIVEVIDSIAGQTNLLALNAAIEAARAGDHGKGFAVVADEVRKLAETSGKATKEITALVTGIGESTAAAASAVKQGVALTEEAGRQFREITALIQNTLDVMMKISKKSRHEAESTGTLVNVAESIAAVTREAAASTVETASSAQELAAIADRLKQDADLVKKSFQSGLS